MRLHAAVVVVVLLGVAHAASASGMASSSASSGAGAKKKGTSKAGGKSSAKSNDGALWRTVEFGSHGFVEWRHGSLPIVLSAPHGGALRPDNVADRKHGVTTEDIKSLHLALDMGRAMAEALGGRAPHIVACHLHRSKLDANRDVEKAAQGDPLATVAHSEYHAFVERAIAEAVAQFGFCHVFDIHGHGHQRAWIEVGFGLTATELQLGDGEMNALANKTSIKKIAERSSVAAVVRGNMSLGALLHQHGHEAVPSPAVPHPGGEHYFNGGYTVVTHGGRRKDGKNVDATQLEHPLCLRRTKEARVAYAKCFAAACVEWVRAWYGFDLASFRAPQTPLTRCGGCKRDVGVQVVPPAPVARPAAQPHAPSAPPLPSQYAPAPVTCPANFPAMFQAQCHVQQPYAVAAPQCCAANVPPSYDAVMNGAGYAAPPSGPYAPGPSSSYPVYAPPQSTAPYPANPTGSAKR